MVQRDFCYFKTAGDPTTTAILTGIGVETEHGYGNNGWRQATRLPVPWQLHPIIPCGMRQTTGSTQQHHPTIRSIGSPCSTLQHHRQAVTGIQLTSSVERFHRTLMGQIRTLRAQLQQNHDRTVTSKHPLVPWLVRHTAHLLNRYATHADGNISYFRRWNKDYRAPLCEFGETVLYLLPTVKQPPKMEQRFFKAIRLGRDTATGERLLDIGNKVARARTTRRMPKPDKYDKQMFDVISRTGYTMTPPPTSQAQLQPPMVFHKKAQQL